jgi:two-component system LytT family sensor kinase
MKKLIVIPLHIVYWLVYYFVFVMFLLMVTRDLGLKVLPNGQLFLVWFSCFFIPGIISFYSCYTFLFSKFLKEKRILALLIYSIFVFLTGVLIEEAVLLKYIMPSPGFAKMGLTSASGIAVLLFLIALINGIMGFVLKGFVSWYGDIKLKEKLNKKNYEMELALVKNQITPHFLFNTINNIDIMITEDALQASAYLNKLSDIMRFMLYETKTEMIPLAKELNYIEKYIDLQKIRTSNSEYVNYKVEGDVNSFHIAPMLFIPFIENAFKHADNKNINNVINIKLSIDKKMITFECENKFDESIKNILEESGLGNDLISKRLQLLYPNKHKLSINEDNQIYSVKLIVLKNED